MSLNSQYDYSNFTIQNQFYDQKYTLETLKSEYFQLKNLEHNNPKLIKEKHTTKWKLNNNTNISSNK